MASTRAYLGEGFLTPTDDGSQEWHVAFNVFLRKMQLRHGRPGVAGVVLGFELEAFSQGWLAASERDLPLLPDERRIGDAIARLLGEFATVPDPPKDIVGSAIRWCLKRLDEFGSEAAKSAGQSVGKGIGYGIGIGTGAGAVMGIPELHNIATTILRRLGE